MDDNFFMIFKIIIVGDSGVGKTGLLSRFVHNTFSENSKATVGVEFGGKKVVIDGKNLKAQIWDTAGQERYRSVTNAYYKGALGALIVYDITKRNSFESVENWLKQVKSMGDKNIRLMLVGNKSDLEDQREIKTTEGQELAEQNNIAFFETSAKNADNVNEAFDKISTEIYNTYSPMISNNDNVDEFLNNIDGGNNNIDLSKNKQDDKKDKKCC